MVNIFTVLLFIERRKRQVTEPKYHCLYSDWATNSTTEESCYGFRQRPETSVLQSIYSHPVSCAVVTEALKAGGKRAEASI
jgi:hypothetical protein